MPGPFWLFLILFRIRYEAVQALLFSFVFKLCFLAMFQGGQAWKVFFFTVLTPTWEGYLARLPGTKELEKKSCCLTCLTLGRTIMRFCIFSVAMFIPDPRSRIPDHGSKNSNKRDRWKKLVLYCTFFVATNFTKLKIIVFLKCWREKFGQIFKDLQNFSPKNFH